MLTDKTAKTPAGALDSKAVVEIAIAIRGSIICGQFLALVVVDDQQKPVGYFRPEFFLEILRIPLVSYGSNEIAFESVYKQLESSELGAVLAHPIVRAQSNDAEHETIGAEVTTEIAYSQMLEKRSMWS